MGFVIIILGVFSRIMNETRYDIEHELILLKPRVIALKIQAQTLKLKVEMMILHREVFLKGRKK
jgi:hypothetical protein